MFTPREMLYINTFLEKEGRGIWYHWFIDGYKVEIERPGRYVIEFGNQHQAIEFYKRITVGQNVGTSMKDGVIVINKESGNGCITIDCGKNDEFANKLTKHLRKQWVLIRRQELKQQAINHKTASHIKKQEIENTGIKF